MSQVKKFAPIRMLTKRQREKERENEMYGGGEK